MQQTPTITLRHHAKGWSPLFLFCGILTVVCKICRVSNYFRHPTQSITQCTKTHHVHIIADLLQRPRMGLDSSAIGRVQSSGSLKPSREPIPTWRLGLEQPWSTSSSPTI